MSPADAVASSCEPRCGAECRRMQRRSSQHLGQHRGVRATTCSPRSIPRSCATARWSIVPRDAAVRDAGASAVHRDASGRGELSARAWWLPKPAARCTVIEDYVALQPETLLHQCGDRDRARANARMSTTSGAARERPGVSHRDLRGVARAREPLSVGQRRARRADLALRPQRAAERRGRRVHDRRARADRRAPARRHAHLHRSRAAERAQPPAAQVHRRRRRARGVQRQDHGAPGRAAHRFGAVRAATCC